MSDSYYEQQRDYLEEQMDMMAYAALIDLYLMHSYLLRDQNELLLNQEDFDELCEFLLEGWDRMPITSRGLIRKDDLENKTCTLRLDKAFIRGNSYPLGMMEAIEAHDNRIMTMKGVCEVDFSPD